MSKKDLLVRELRAIRSTIECLDGDIKGLLNDLAEKRKILENVVEGYQGKRLELLAQEFKQRKITWCTHCSVVVLEGAAELVFINGKKERDCGSGTYRFESFTELHRVCPACRENMADKHGMVGTYDTQARDQSSFYAFKAEKRDDGYWARQFGTWTKLAEEDCVLENLPEHLVIRLSAQWGLPPDITFYQHMQTFGGSELKIHEQAETIAQAS